MIYFGLQFQRCQSSMVEIAWWSRAFLTWKSGNREQEYKKGLGQDKSHQRHASSNLLQPHPISKLFTTFQQFHIMSPSIDESIHYTKALMI
jgi:hypothetical protein